MPLWTITVVVGRPTLHAVAKACAAGFQAWTPVLLTRHRGAGRGTETSVRAAYPGYAFIADISFAALRWRLPDLHFACLEGEGSELDDAAIYALRQLEAEWRRPPPPAPPRIRFREGAEVNIVAGLFTGRRGVVEHDNGTHVRLAIATGPVRRFTVPAGCVAAALAP